MAAPRPARWLGMLAATPLLLAVEVVYLAGMLLYAVGFAVVTVVRFGGESIEQHPVVARHPLRPSRLQPGLERYFPPADPWRPPLP